MVFSVLRTLVLNTLVWVLIRFQPLEFGSAQLSLNLIMRSRSAPRGREQ